MFVVFPHSHAGAYEVSIPYNGSAAHAAAAGILRLVNQDPPGQTIHYHPGSSSVVQVGWLFVRRVLGLDPGTGQPNSFDAYIPAGDPNALPSSFQGSQVVTFPAP